MRIIGGEFGGRLLHPPMKKWPTRPTTDIAKEALYNILANRIDFEDVSMLDLFGGTGMHSLEFLSRGCQKVVYVDKYYPSVRWVKEQVSLLGVEDRIRLMKKDVKSYLSAEDMSFDIIFADPPYALPWINSLPDLIIESSAFTDTLIIEHSNHTSFDQHDLCHEVRKYGQTRFSFFSSSE